MTDQLATEPLVTCPRWDSAHVAAKHVLGLKDSNYSVTNETLIDSVHMRLVC